MTSLVKSAQSSRDFHIIKQKSGDVITGLQSRSFKSRSFSEKLALVMHGRPMPQLKDLRYGKTKGTIRHFNPDLYRKVIWLSGSEELSKLFCWPCLLFAKVPNVWNDASRGYNDLKNISKATRNHASSGSHITAWILYTSFGKTVCNSNLNKEKNINDPKHHEKVIKNREILRRLITVACFLGQQEITFWDRSEHALSNNKCNYTELVHMLIKYDEKLSGHLEQSNMFNGLTRELQIDIIQAVHNVMISEIKTELKSAKFVAIIVDEISDIPNHSRVSVVFRYVLNCTVFERFVGFSDVGADRSATFFSELVLELLEEFQCKHKLVAQAYDGAAVLSEELNKVQKSIKEIVSEAHLMHFYGHELNLVLSQAVSSIPECRIFFASLSEFSAFFEYSTKTNALHSILQDRFPTLCSSRWNPLEHLVQTVCEHKLLLTELSESILQNPEDWDNITINKARGFLSIFSDFGFNFFLNIFQSVFTLTGVFVQIVQTKPVNIIFSCAAARKLNRCLEEMQEVFESFWSTAEKISDPPKKLIKLENGGSSKEHYRNIYQKFFDTLRMQVALRFNYLETLKFIELLDCKKYHNHSKTFPEEDFQKLKYSYGNFFNLPLLKTELNVMYISPTLNLKNIVELLRTLEENGLHHGLPELYKFCSLILTIPATLFSTKHSFSTLKLSSISQSAQEISGLPLIFIEKELLTNMMSEGSFYDDVIAELSKKNYQTNLIFN